MQKLCIIKIGGNVIDDDAALLSFLEDFAKIKDSKILVHGGGKMATRVASAMGIGQQMINGRRITDKETLKVVTMVYAGYINKNIVAGLQANHCNAVGLTGADADVIRAHKRIHADIDYGFAGDVDVVNATFIQGLLEKNITPVFSPITHDKKGTLLNTNADTIANEIAKAMSAMYHTALIYCFEQEGVLTDINESDSVINSLDKDMYRSLVDKNIISGGMIPKMDNAFAALEAGVKKVVIGNAAKLSELLQQKSGTTIE